MSADTDPGADAADSASDVADEADVRLHGARVLLVEDERALARTLERLISGAGCSVVCASTGAEARRIFDGGRESFDAAVVDVGLPDESGFNLVHALREGQHPCSAVVMTGNPIDEVVHTSITAGVSDFLVKPFGPTLLFAAVSRAIEHTRCWRFRLASHWDRAALLEWPSFEGYARAEGRSVAPMAGALDLVGTVERLAKRGKLTARERETTELLLRGYRNDEIASALSISAHTAKYHVRNILRKLSLETRTDLFRLLLE